MTSICSRALAIVASAALLAACSSTGSDTDKSSDTPDGRTVALTVDIDSCGDAWSSDDGGATTFAITNTFYNSTDAYLTNAKTGNYIAEYEGIGTGATFDQTVRLGNGSYRFLCFPDGQAEVPGPTVTVSGAPEGVRTAEVAPVSTGALIGPSQAYKTWIMSRLPTLRRQTAALAADVRSGPTAQARADWLAAHLTYETLGAAYDAFSSGDTDFDGDINGTPAPSTDPATDRDLAGFHRLEALLWTGASSDRLVPVADALVTDVGKLVTAFPGLDIEPNDLPLRSHEIVENTIQLELNGETDAGSHTNLATAWANLTGAQHALVALDSILRDRYPDLARTKKALASTKDLLVSLEHPGRSDGGWPPLSSLTERQRAQVNGAFQHTVELLAPIAAICDVRNVVQP